MRFRVEVNFGSLPRSAVSESGRRRQVTAYINGSAQKIFKEDANLADFIIMIQTASEARPKAVAVYCASTLGKENAYRSAAVCKVFLPCLGASLTPPCQLLGRLLPRQTAL